MKQKDFLPIYSCCLKCETSQCEIIHVVVDRKWTKTNISYLEVVGSFKINIKEVVHLECN